MNERSEPELDFDLLNDWCDLCDGSREFESHYFDTILMGAFLGGLTPEVDSFLKRFTKPFAPPLYNNLIRIAEEKTLDRDIVPWVKRDLDEKLKVLESYAETAAEARELVRLIRAENYSFMHNESEFLNIKHDSENHYVMVCMVSDFEIDAYTDRRFYALSEVLYHIATSVEVENSIMPPLLDIPVDLSHYFEIYLRGGDYALTDNGILVYRDASHPSNE